MNHPTLILIGDLILMVGMVAIVLFTFFYGIRSPWKQYLAGRTQFYLGLSCSLILALVAYSRLATTYGLPFPERDWIRIVAYGFISFTLVRTLITLLRYQRRERHKKRASITHSADSAKGE